MSKTKQEVDIPLKKFPNESKVDKSTEEFGLSVGQAIQAEWFSPVKGSCVFYSRWVDFHNRRLYARAEQPVQKYKSAISVDGDMSHMNLDFTPVPIINKFVDIVVNGMTDRDMSIKAFSQDVISAEKRSIFQDAVEADMISKDFLEKTKDDFGVDAFNVDPEKLPETPDELSLYMNLKYKPSIEIAEEVAIDTIFLENNYSDLKTRLDYDQVVLGMSVASHDFQINEGIKLNYEDPAEFVHSYTEDPFFRDIFYGGVVKRVHINELVKIKPSITLEEIEQIKRTSSEWGTRFDTVRRYDLFQADVVNLLYFNYKTLKETVYKSKRTKNGGRRLSKKSVHFNPEPNELFERKALLDDVWYSGVLVLGTNILLQWKQTPNMAVSKGASKAAVSNYVACAPRMYKGSIDSLVRRMIPFADQIQLTHLKLQQVKQKMVPDGVFIDVDGINNVDLGTGAAYTPESALRLYFQTGSVIGRSFTQDGDFNNARQPIQELNSSSGQSKMAALVSDYNHNLNMLRDVTGLNEARDASTPDPKALVGIQKLAALNSNTATRHVLRAGEYITRTLAECVSLRISDVLKYSDWKEDFAMKIGKYNMEILSDIKDLPLYSFGIFIELAPDEEEKQIIEGNIAISLQEKQIELEDAVEIRSIRNPKLANEMLKTIRRRRTKERQQREDVQMQMQAQIQQQSQQMASEAASRKTKEEAEAKIMVETVKASLQKEVENNSALLKAQLMDKEFAINMQLKGIEVDAQLSKVDTQEDRKDKRIDRQSTQQSELIDQRKNNLPPKDFESVNDNLDDLDLSSFDPK